MVNRLRLPNGLDISYIDRQEALFIFDEIFESEKYIANGITLPDNATVIDAGANIGLFSIYVKQRAPHAHIVAIEPIPDIVSVLQDNLRNLSACRVLACGLSSADGPADLTYLRKCPALSGRYVDAAVDGKMMRAVMMKTNPALAAVAGPLVDSRLRGRPVRCLLRRLSSVIDDEGIGEIDLLKVDVEKSEMDVLAGIDDHHWPRIRQMVLETHDENGRLADMTRLLEGRGYRVHVDQDALFSETDIHVVYARRDSSSYKA